MKKEELIPGRWYSGTERLLGNIGLWTGAVFAGFTFKCGHHMDAAEWFDPKNNYKLLELPE